MSQPSQPEPIEPEPIEPEPIEPEPIEPEPGGSYGEASAQALVAGRPGFYQLDPIDPDVLRAAGWSVARLGRTKGFRTFYNEATMALGLPTWFGRNLDALWEVLLDLDRPTVLVFADWQPMASRHRRDWRRLTDVLVERALTPPDVAAPLAVVLEGEGEPHRLRWSASP